MSCIALDDAYLLRLVLQSLVGSRLYSRLFPNVVVHHYPDPGVQLPSENPPGYKATVAGRRAWCYSDACDGSSVTQTNSHITGFASE